MSLTTYSKFYFGHTVTTTNQYLDFSEGGGELTAIITAGEYSLTDFAQAIEDALNSAGALVYTVTVTRSTQKLTIAATGTFSLLGNTGTHVGADIFSLMGFTNTNQTGAATYTGSAISGSVYAPQFILQDHVPSDNFQQAADASVTKTANGTVEVVKFGTEKFVQFRIRFSNDITQPSAGPIKSNASGVSNLRTFMQYITERSPIEFMPNENATSTFQTLAFEKSADSSTGTGYKLKELFDRGLPGYYDTEILTFRLIE